MSVSADGSGREPQNGGLWTARPSLAVKETNRMTASALPVRFNGAAVAARNTPPPRAAFLPARCRARLAALAVLVLLPACATTSVPSAGPGENEGISGYVACLNAAAHRIDDGRSHVASVAAAIKGMCAAQYPEPAGATAAARAKSEARQMELSTMVVQDLRGQP
jgi:hypothetical protein